MAKKNTKRKLIGLVSKASGIRQYYTTYNPQNELQKQGKSKIVLRKYDPKTRKHEIFEQTKKNLGRNEVKARKG
jgi:large subunit ribosomal protein L33